MIYNLRQPQPGRWEADLRLMTDDYTVRDALLIVEDEVLTVRFMKDSDDPDSVARFPGIAVAITPQGEKQLRLAAWPDDEKDEPSFELVL